MQGMRRMRNDYTRIGSKGDEEELESDEERRRM